MGKMSYIKLTSFENGSIGDLDIYVNTRWIRTIERSLVHGDDAGTRLQLVGLQGSFERNPIWVAETPHQILGMIEKTEERFCEDFKMHEPNG